MEKVLECKGNKVQVKWLDYEVPTWEPLSAIPCHLLLLLKKKKEKIMEGSQRLIGQSTMSTLMIDESLLPEDHPRLRINSNDTCSRQFHPKNNCYSFAIEFDQLAAEALQYRINQCNHYQIISVTTPIQSTLGILHSPDAIVKLIAPVI